MKAEDNKWDKKQKENKTNLFVSRVRSVRYVGLIVPANSNLVPSALVLRPERMFVFWFIFLCSFYFLSAFLLFALLSLGLFRVYKIRTTMDMFPVLFRCK